MRGEASFEIELFILVRISKAWGGAELLFKLFKGLLLRVCPLENRVLLEELGKWSGNFGIVLYELSRIIAYA